MVFNSAKYKITTLAVFLICNQVAFCRTVQLNAKSAGGTWKSNCFKQTDSGRCEDSRIKICSNYYTCDMIVEMAAPPKRIGYMNENILAAIGAQTFVIQNETLSPMTSKRIIPPWDEFVDTKDNRYYTADGTTYMVAREANKEIEIITSGQYSVNQLAFDKVTDQLLILAFSTQTETNERTGSLFAINTASIDVLNDKVQADIIDGAGDSITSMAMEGDLGKLLLGLKTPNGGKLIRLIRQKANPCSENSAEGRKSAILAIIKEAQEKLLKMFDDVSITPSHENLLYRSGPDEKSLKSLEIENIRLKRDLQVAEGRLNSLTRKLFNFNNHFKSMSGITLSTTASLKAPELVLELIPNPMEQLPDRQDRVSSNAPSRSHNNGYDVRRTQQIDEISEIKKRKQTSTIEEDVQVVKAEAEEKDEQTVRHDQCVPIHMYNLVVRQADETENRNRELKKRLDEVSTNVERILLEADQPTDLKPL